MPSKSDNAEVSKASPKDKIKQVQVLEHAASCAHLPIARRRSVCMKFPR
jgi:hypothetical protein